MGVDDQKEESGILGSGVKYCLFLLGFHAVVLRVYTWLYAWESLLTVWYWETNLDITIYKAGTLPTVPIYWVSKR